MSELIEKPPCPICGGALYRRKPPAAAAAAVGGDEITAEKLAKEGWHVGMASPHVDWYQHEDFSISIGFRRITRGGLTTWQLREVVLELIEEGCELNITTMTELRTLIRWLS